MYKSEYEELCDKEWLEKHYVTKRWSMGQIAREIGCAFPAVKAALIRHGLPIRPRIYKSKYPKLNDKEWLVRMYTEKGKTCKDIADIVGCPPGLIQQHLNYLHVKMRPKQKGTGKLAAHWQGGRKIQDGYVFLYNPGHPRTTRNDPYVQEHRLVMEDKLGRYLEPYEVVHHKDGNRQNNDPSNLVVKTRSKHLSDHFATGDELTELHDEIKRLKTRITELEAELKRAS